MIYYHDHPYGSASLAHPDDVLRAFRNQGGMPFAYMGRRMLTHSSSAGALLVSGAGAGKFTTVLSHMLAAKGRNGGPVRIASFGPKGEELSVIGHGLIHRGARVYSVAPYGVAGFPNHRINLWAHLVPHSPTLVADCRSAAQQLISLTGGGDARFFEQKAQNWLEAIIRGLVYLEGEVSHLRLFEVVNLIRASIEAWEQLSETIARRGSPDLHATYSEMLYMARNSERTFSSVMGEVSNAMAKFSDPRLQGTFVGTAASDFDLSVLTEDSDDDIYVFFVIPVELTAQYAMLVRQFFSTIRILKQRKPSAPVIDLVCDEAALLGNYEDAAVLYTAGRGFGLSPFFVYQSLSQIERNLGPTGVSTLMASSDLKIFLGQGVSDERTATQVSRMLGQQTLHLPDPLVQERAVRGMDELTHSVLFEGTDPVRAGLAMRALEEEMHHTRKIARALMTPDEIINLLKDKALILPSGYDCDPFIADKVPYFRKRAYAGLYHPNPFFDADPHSLLVRSFWGTWRRRVIREAVPDVFADFPQYQNGEWQFIKGFRPKT